jgi:ubiquinone/menaquinone biosynthesis C-methylase UbiE
MDEVLGSLNLENAKILEIGGSTGRDLIKYFGKNNNTCVEMDINPFLGIASEIIMKHKQVYYERVRADMNKLPFQDNQFDVVFGSATFHHIDNPTNCFKEVNRVLKPGGTFYCLNERVLTSLRPELKEKIAKELEFAHEHAFFSSEWTSFLSDAGFSVKLFRPRYFTYEQIIERIYGKSKPKKMAGKLKHNYYKMMHKINLNQSNPMLRFIQRIEDKYLANVPYNAICNKK